MTGADIFRNEWPGVLKELTPEQIQPFNHLNIVGLVGSIDNDMSLTDARSIDNDMSLTDATIGAYSSLTRVCENVDRIDATAKSHSRAFVIETMGRHCGIAFEILRHRSHWPAL